MKNKYHLTFTLRLLLLLLLFSGKVYGKEATPIDLDQLLEGFDGDYPVVDVLVESYEKPTYPSTELTGTLSGYTSYAVREHTTSSGYTVDGFRSIKTRLAVETLTKITPDWVFKFSGWASYDFNFTLEGREEFSSEVLDRYEKELELGETYIRGRLIQSVDITFGRQIVVWGKGDLFRLVDMWNPVDSRNRGLSDNEITRLPVLMSKIDFYPGSWQFSTVVSHEYRYNKLPVFGNDFYPFSFPEPPREEQSSGPESWSFGVSAQRTLKGADIGIYLGSFEKELDRIGLTEETSARRSSRLTLFGLGLEKALPNWLIKLETAWIEGFEYYSIPDREESRFDILLGADYSGLSKTQISLEMINRYLPGLDEDQANWVDTPYKNSFIWAFRLARSFLRQTCTVTLHSYAGGVDFSKGSAQKLSVKYKFNDSLSLAAGYLFVQSGDSFLSRNVGDNDSWFAKVQYFF